MVAPPLAQPNGGPPPGGIPPELARAVVANLPSGPPTYAREKFLSLPPQAQQQLLAEALSQNPPSGLAGPQGGPLPPAALMTPPQGPPQGPVGPPGAGPGLPGPQGPQPIPPGGPGPMPARAPREPENPVLRPSKKPKPPPPLPLDPLPEDPWGPGGPDYDRFLAYAKGQRDRMGPRQTAWEAVRRLYQRDPQESRLKRPSSDTGGVPVEPDYIRPQPALNLQRHVEQTALTRERLWLQCKPAARDRKTVDAAQHVEDWLRTCLAYSAMRWSARGTVVGDPRQDLPYEDAGLPAMFGVWAGFVGLDLANQDRPRCYYEPVSPYEIFPGRITTRQYTQTLGEFRAEWPEQADDWWPRASAERRKAEPDRHAEEDKALVGVVAGSDHAGIWHVVAVKEGAGWPQGWAERPEVKGAVRWVKREKVNFGFCPYLYLGLVGTPGGAIADDRATFEAHRFYGTLGQTGDAYRQQNDLIFWLKEAIKVSIKPWTIEYGDSHPQPQLGQWAGAENRRPATHKIEIPGRDLAAAPSMQAMFAVANADVQDAVPPVLAGRGGGSQSGVAQHEQSEFAATLYVDPLRHLLTRVYQTICLCWCELARRHGGEGAGKAALDALPYTVHKGGEAGAAATLRPVDIARNGYDRWAGERLTVEYVEANETEKMQRLQYAERMVHNDFWKRLSAMEYLRVEDPEQERSGIFADKGVYLDPNMQKLVAGEALAEIFDPDSPQMLEWRFSRAQEARPRGMPSPTGPPDGGLPGPVANPGAPSPQGIPGIVG